MKRMQKIEDFAYGIIGLFYANIHFGWLGITWGEFRTEALKFAWTLTVSACTAGVAVLAKRWVQKYLDKRDKKKSSSS